MHVVRNFVLLIFAMKIVTGSAQAQNLTEGKSLYARHCSACHGDGGKGDGLAARGLPAKPADHTNPKVMNRLSDKYLFDVISKGGAGIGKSPFMPAWGSALNDKQIQDIVVFIRSLTSPGNPVEGRTNK